MPVHASRSEISQSGGKTGFHEMLEGGNGRSNFWQRLDFLILCCKEGASCGEQAQSKSFVQEQCSPNNENGIDWRDFACVQHDILSSHSATPAPCK